MKHFEDLREEMLELIADEVAIGSLNAFEIKDAALDFLQDEGLEISKELDARVAEQVNAALDFHYLKQQGWTEETDAEKLEEAFMELWLRNIIAASNFTCCQSCGHTEMASWLAQSDAQQMRGYVFYHQQDARSMTKSDYLYLAYGSRSQSTEDGEAIAREAVEVLQRHGLDVSWSGSVRTRIHITNISWRVRRLKEVDYAE